MWGKMVTDPSRARHNSFPHIPHRSPQIYLHGPVLSIDRRSQGLVRADRRGPKIYFCLFTFFGRHPQSRFAHGWASDRVCGADSCATCTLFRTGSVPGASGAAAAPEGRKSTEKLGARFICVLSLRSAQVLHGVTWDRRHRPHTPSTADRVRRSCCRLAPQPPASPLVVLQILRQGRYGRTK